MPQNIVFNGTTYAIPLAGELNWSSLSAFLIDVGTNAAVDTDQKQSIRVAVTTPVTVAAASDYAVVANLTVPGPVAVTLPAGIQGQIFLILDGKGDALTNNVTISTTGGQTINGAATVVLNKNRQAVMVQYHTGSTDWKIHYLTIPPGTIVDSDVSATAALSRAKIAAGSANHVIIDDGAGLLSSEAQLATTRGGTGISSTATFPASGVIVTEAGTEVLTNKDYAGGVASNTSRLTLPSDTLANLTALTRKAGTIVYATDTGLEYVDDGATLNPLSTAVDASPSQTGLVNITTQSFGGSKKFVDGAVDVGYLAAANSIQHTPLVDADHRVQCVLASGGDINAILPSTSILAGEAFKIVNRGAGSFNVNIKADDNSLIYILGGEGYGVVRALVNSPATSTDWVMEDTVSAQFVRCTVGNGTGSTNTVIRRFVNSNTIGSCITYADSATNGALFTINLSGIYSISYSDNSNAPRFGVTINSSQLTTEIGASMISQILTISTVIIGAPVNPTCAAWTGQLAAGSLIRPHTNSGLLEGSPNLAIFTIARIC